MSKMPCPSPRYGRCCCVSFTYRIQGAFMAAWIVTAAAVTGVAVHHRPVHVAVAIVVVLLYLPFTLWPLWWWESRKFQRGRLVKVHAYTLERDIEALERELGVGLGEDWWRP